MQSGATTPSRLARSTPRSAPASPPTRPTRRASMVPLVFAAGGLVALAYSTIEQFVNPLRGSREFGLERAGLARLLMAQHIFDIAALIPTVKLADRQGAAHVPMVLPPLSTAAIDETVIIIRPSARSTGTLAIHG